MFRGIQEIEEEPVEKKENKRKNVDICAENKDRLGETKLETTSVAIVAFLKTYSYLYWMHLRSNIAHLRNKPQGNNIKLSITWNKSCYKLYKLLKYWTRIQIK